MPGQWINQQPETLTHLLENGDFETNIDGWVGFNGTETLARETSDPLSGTGSLKCTYSNAAGVEGLFVTVPVPNDNDGWPVDDGATLRVAFTIQGDNGLTMIAELSWLNAGGSTYAWRGRARTTPTTVLFETNVPPGADNVFLAIFAHAAEQEGEFLIDDVTVAIVE